MVTSISWSMQDVQRQRRCVPYRYSFLVLGQMTRHFHAPYAGDPQLWTKPKVAEVERRTMLRAFLCTRTYLIRVAICICFCMLTGCVESSFTLAGESKLPRSISLPPGLTRADVSVILNLYAPLQGPDAKFVLIDRKGKDLEEVKGKTKEITPLMYRIVTEKGITETVRLKPYREHENMEQNGRAVALFYVIDDQQ